MINQTLIESSGILDSISDHYLMVLRIRTFINLMSMSHESDLKELVAQKCQFAEN